MPQRILYVGGLGPSVSEEQLALSFNPFGYLKSVQIKDKEKHFAFVEFEEEEDAKSAMDNMNGAEINGRVLIVNIAHARSAAQGKAAWAAEADVPDQGGETIA
tara:strand:+ start:897 stop:1205 length:309 start_codon:yes stop_codon:yes gene_type:complete